MAWRIEEQLVCGEIDNRVRGRVTGRLWFHGRTEPVILDLKGNAWRDLAGHVLRFTNPALKPGAPDTLKRFLSVQRGVVGDITASRKVKVPDCSMEELMALFEARKPFPWHWGNCLYLEWHGDFNGRVVIESANYTLDLDPVAAWTMSEAEETLQREENGRALIALMVGLSGVASDPGADEHPPETVHADETEHNDDAEVPPPQNGSEEEAEQLRMDLLLDRVHARIARARAAGETPAFEQIVKEERERLRRERGEPESPQPTPDEEAAEHAAWLVEVNAIVDRIRDEIDSGKWRNADDGLSEANEHGPHPLVVRCRAFADRLIKDSESHGWLTENDAHEHPLRELTNGVMIAAAELTGALGTTENPWPPEPSVAGEVLMRLKKARKSLRDAQAGLTVADERSLVEARWRAEVRTETNALFDEVQRLIAALSEMLRNTGTDGESAAGDS